VSLLKVVATDLIKYGEVRRGYIGVQIKDVDQTMADAIGMKETKGILVDKLVKDGAAEHAGVREGDVILTVDGKEVNAANELQSYVATHHPGDEVTLKIFRDGKTFEKKVTLKARDQKTEVARDSGGGKEEEPGAELEKTTSFETLGLTVRPLSAREKEELSLDRGVLITAVRSYSEAYNRGLRGNMVLLDVDRKGLTSVSQLKKTIEGHKAGESVLLRVKVDEQTVTFVALQIPK
jgi:serine protease Do